MSTYYVIRAGHVRGEGAYYCGGCDHGHIVWTYRRSDAFPFQSRAAAELKGRGRVVKVTRRDPDEIRADERAAIVAAIRRKRDRLDCRLARVEWETLDSLAISIEAMEDP